MDVDKQSYIILTAWQTAELHLLSNTDFIYSERQKRDTIKAPITLNQYISKNGSRHLKNDLQDAALPQGLLVFVFRAGKKRLKFNITLEQLKIIG